MKKMVKSVARLVVVLIPLLQFSACSDGSSESAKTATDSIGQKAIPDSPQVKKDLALVTNIADAATILARKQVPILCYHQLRDYKPGDSKVARDYIVPPAVFREQMQALADSGYTTILPDQLYNYLAGGEAIPEKSVMITFDDTDLEQFTVGNEELKKHGFKGVYFIMTVSLGRPRYMSKDQVKQLAEEGNVIASHTWDHHNVKKYAGEDWVTQIEKPSKQLEAIAGKPVYYFAYPFGLWNKEAIPELKKRGIKAAFQLSEKRDESDPLYTIRRIIITGTMSGKATLAKMRSSF
jgi:peptidoglycan/xylan/chitin deacetylase (PgdA/CDA1 family)